MDGDKNPKVVNGPLMLKIEKNFQRILKFQFYQNLKSADFESELKQTIESKFTNHPGNLEKVWFPTNRSNSIKWLKNFLEKGLLSLVIMKMP